MKETISKKMKEASVLLITVAMILSTVSVTADTNESIELMRAGEDLQSQQTNTFDPDWIHFDDGTNVNAIGLTGGGTFEFAIRITPTELVGYDAWEVTTVKWHHGMAGNPQPSHSGTIKIYDAGTSKKPGALITSEAFTTAASSEWEETALSNPVTIDASKDIWVSVWIIHVGGEYPAGVDPGPVVPGKGGWINHDGSWKQLGIDYPSLNNNWNIWAEVKEPSEPPEKPQRPDGPIEGIVGVEYTFCTSTTDPEGDMVCYLWDWDDGTSTDWLGPFDSGETACATHAWTEAGDYDITVKAKDVHDAESERSDPLTIHIFDTAILEICNITGRLFKVSTVIKNTGGVDAIKVNWSITLDGGFIILGKKTTGDILSIPAGDEAKISSILIFGFGKTVITVTAECAEGSSDTNTRDAFVLLFFIF